MKHWKIALGTSLIAFIILVALVSNFEYLPVKSCIDSFDIEDSSLIMVEKGKWLYCSTTSLAAILGTAGLAASPLIGRVVRRNSRI